jgi:peroxiredoxin
MRLIPNEPVPALDVALVDGGRFRLSEQHPQAFSLIAVYRGYHCPICRTYLGELRDHAPALSELGVIPIAVSSDDAERAQKTKTEWELGDLALGYGLSIDAGRAWGLYVSKAISPKEPPLFLEPGLFLVRPDGALYCASVQTMPFARPSIKEIAGAIGFVTKNNYPARGES